MENVVGGNRGGDRVNGKESELEVVIVNDGVVSSRSRSSEGGVVLLVARVGEKSSVVVVEEGIGVGAEFVDDSGCYLSQSLGRVAAETRR